MVLAGGFMPNSDTPGTTHEFSKRNETIHCAVRF